MSGHALEKTATAEVVAAWHITQKVVPAVADTPGWHALGDFELPKTVKAALQVRCLVSGSGLTCRVRIWDVVANAPVNGEVLTTSQSPASLLGPSVTLNGGQYYQLQAECTGGTGEENFAVVQSASITD